MGILSFTEGVISMEAQSLKLRNSKFVVKVINDFIMVSHFAVNFLFSHVKAGISCVNVNLLVSQLWCLPKFLLFYSLAKCSRFHDHVFLGNQCILVTRTLLQPGIICSPFSP